MEAPEHLQVMGFEKGKACGDHFIVEDLLDFSNGVEEEGEGEEELVFDSSSSIVLQNSAESSSAVAPIEYCSSTSPISATCEPHFLGEDLCVPYDELAELEWLSHFVEDSFSADSSSHKLQPLPSSTTPIIPITTAHKPSTLTTTTTKTNLPNNTTTTNTSNLTTTTNAISYTPQPPRSPSPSIFTTDPPVRCARSKRCRSAPRDWASRLLVLTPPTNPIPPEASLLPPPLTPTTHDNHHSSTSSNCPPPLSTKKHSKTTKKHQHQQQHPHHHSNLFEPSLAPNPDGRKCLHCATEKTPQWRTGPMGPKTLCNACGVRYKSGRLVPEYRPAASPTFVLSKHSNSHRKVMELRRQKELHLQHPPQRGGGSGDHHRPANGNGLFVGPHYHQQQHRGGDNGGGYCEESDDFLIQNHLRPDFRQLI